MRDPEYETISGDVVHITDKAVLFKSAQTSEESWIPKSVICEGDMVDESSTELEVEQWFCDKEGLE